MIVDYIVVVLFLIILIRIIKRLGIYRFIIASVMLELIYWSMRIAGKEINLGYVAGLLLVAVLAILSYKTVNMLAKRGYHKQSLVTWLIFGSQFLLSPFLILFVMRSFNGEIECFAFSKNILICKNAILMGGDKVFHLPDVSILAIINITAFVLIQIISRINLAEHEYIPIT